MEEASAACMGNGGGGDEHLATFEDLSIDDSLGTLERVERYAGSHIALQRCGGRVSCVIYIYMCVCVCRWYVSLCVWPGALCWQQLGWGLALSM